MILRMNGVYLTRSGFNATVWWLVISHEGKPPEKAQYFVRDERGYDFEVNGHGKFYHDMAAIHPLGLIKDTGLTVRLKKHKPEGYYRRAPEAKDSANVARQAKALRCPPAKRGRGRPATGQKTPWVELGVSKATYYRQQRASNPVGNSDAQ